MYFVMQPTYCPFTHSYLGHMRSGKPINKPSLVDGLLRKMARKFRGPQMPYAVNERNVIVAHPPTAAMPDGIKAA